MMQEGRIAIVTGAASGIGLAIAQRLAGDGAHVVMADLNESAAHAAAQRIRESGGLANAAVVDVSCPESVDELFKSTVSAHRRVDVMVNNAGIGVLDNFLDLPFDRWRKTIDVNLNGVFLCGQAAARVMVGQHGGHIVNIASVSGLRASSGRTAYGTSKAAIIHLTRQMALELSRWGVAVNAVAPGPVDTPMVLQSHTESTRRGFTSMIPLDRYGRPEEIAAVVAFLAGPESSYVNGQTIYVDGGFSAVGVVANDLP